MVCFYASTLLKIMLYSINQKMVDKKIMNIHRYSVEQQCILAHHCQKNVTCIVNCRQCKLMQNLKVQKKCLVRKKLQIFRYSYCDILQFYSCQEMRDSLEKDGHDLYKLLNVAMHVLTSLCDLSNKGQGGHFWTN